MLSNPQNLSLFSLALSLFSLLLIGFCFWKIQGLNRLKKTFFVGNNGQDLESVLMSLVEKLHLLEDEKAALEQQLSSLQASTKLAVQRIGTHRFNPFAGGGGNFSFTLALLDGHNTGVVITSMHGREQNRIYAKQVVKGKAETQLTEEEELAIASATSQIN